MLTPRCPGKPLFFFQAEDGIRDVAVTGVQTCALPILVSASRRREAETIRCRQPDRDRREVRPGGRGRPRGRSEERRVGKEWRFLWSPLPSEENGKSQLGVAASWAAVAVVLVAGGVNVI